MKMAYRVDKDVFEYIDKCEGIKVIYGVTFGEDIIKENIFRVDFFCDRREGGKGKYIKNIPIITVLELSEIITRSGKRALILICVGPNEAAVHSIYGDLCRYDIDADVFNYFNSNCFFRDKTFLYKDKIFKLYENIYNCGFINTRMT